MGKEFISCPGTGGKLLSNAAHSSLLKALRNVGAIRAAGRRAPKG